MKSNESRTMSGWASSEVELACIRERTDSKTPVGEWDYGCACYESALKAFLSLTGDGHSGFSVKATKHILNRLIDGKPLTPIEDTPDVWSEITGQEGEKIIYQCKRMSSLFKYVYTDGTVKYSDNNFYYCIDVDEGYSYSSGIAGRVIEEMFPIAMPYYPIEPYRVYCQDILTDRKNGDFDTKGILYAIKPNDERVEINRFFKEDKDTWAEINREEYEERKSLSAKRIQNTSPTDSPEAVKD